MAKVSRINFSRPAINSLGVLSLAMKRWIQSITNQAVITGSGTPEGVVKAPQFSSYKDVDATTTGTILYSKQLAQIGGNTSMGWVLV